MRACEIYFILRDKISEDLYFCITAAHRAKHHEIEFKTSLAPL